MISSSYGFFGKREETGNGQSPLESKPSLSSLYVVGKKWRKYREMCFLATVMACLWLSSLVIGVFVTAWDLTAGDNSDVITTKKKLMSSPILKHPKITTQPISKWCPIITN